MATAYMNMYIQALMVYRTCDSCPLSICAP